MWNGKLYHSFAHIWTRFHGACYMDEFIHNTQYATSELYNYHRHKPTFNYLLPFSKPAIFLLLIAISIYSIVYKLYSLMIIIKLRFVILKYSAQADNLV